MDYNKIIMQWKEFDIPDLLDRDVKADLEIDFLLTITGPRRAGKTYFCFQLINFLKKSVPYVFIRNS